MGTNHWPQETNGFTCLYPKTHDGYAGGYPLYAHLRPMYRHIGNGNQLPSL